MTSDIETLTRFFQWGGLAWLIDGTLMVIVAAVKASAGEDYRYPLTIRFIR